MTRLLQTALLAEAAYFLREFLYNITPFANEGRFFHEMYRGQTDAGLNLWHGLPTANISFYMPLQCLIPALLTQLSPWGVMACAAALWLGCLALAWALGRALFGERAGLAAACLAAPLLPGMHSPYIFGWFETFLFQASVLACALAVVWDAKRRDQQSAGIAGLFFAASLLIRSTLFFLPPLLIFTLRRGRSGLLMGAIPVLALVPWVMMNASLYGGFIPFENGRSDYNVIYAALGKTDNPPGETTQTALKAAGMSEEDSGHVLRWSVLHIARHPLVFLTGCAKRLWYILCIQPIFLLAAAVCFGLYRRNAGVSALAVFTIYFIAIHSLVSVEARYFQPLWPVLAAVLPGFLLRDEPVAPTRVLRVASAIVAPVCLLTLFLVAAYPFRSAPPPPTHEAP